MGKIAMHQPNFMPHTSFFAKIYYADKFLLLDTEQYKHKEWINRNRIYGDNDYDWLTAYVAHNSNTFRSIRDVKTINEKIWISNIISKLYKNYFDHPYFFEVIQLINELLSRYIIFTRMGANDLLLFNYHFILIVCDYLGLKKNPPILQSTLPILPFPDDIDATTKIIKQCKALQCEEYITGIGGLTYLNFQSLNAYGIDVYVLRRKQGVYYPQFNHNVWRGDCSIIDLLMNCSPYECVKYLKDAYYLERV